MICNKCKIEKEDKDFSFRTDQNNLRKTCKLCVKNIKKSHYLKFKESHNKKCSEYYYKNKEKCLETRKRYYLDNIEKAKECRKLYQKKNPQKHRDSCKKYRQNNKEKITAFTRKRQTYKTNSMPKWVNQEELMKFYLKRPKGLVVDHIIPLKNKNISGLHVPWNLQYLTPLENSKKSNKFDFTYNNEGWKK